VVLHSRWVHLLKGIAMSDHLRLRQIKLLISIVLTLFLGAAQAGPVSCKVEAPPFLKSSQLIVLGELHGTREIPKFVSLLACSIKRDPVRLAIAFELPVDEGERITNLIRSKSSRSERKAFFRKSAYWNSVPNDGRRSSAIIERKRSINHTLALIRDGSSR
jgi:hypothetical protein